MLKSSDTINLEYTHDLTQAGIAYACRSIAQAHDRRRKTRFNRIRQMVAQSAVDLAFRRYLIEQEIPHGVIGKTPFSDPNLHKVTLGGRLCHILCDVIINKKRIRQIRQNPETLLSLQINIPTDNISFQFPDENDIYIFSILTALITPDAQSMNKAIKANRPIFLIRPLPSKWSQPKPWKRLDSLTLKSNTTHDIKVIISGLKGNRTYQTEEIQLKPNQNKKVTNEFFSLSHINVNHLPEHTLSISCSNIKEHLTLRPYHWGNIWVYGMEIIFLGYITGLHSASYVRQLSSGSKRTSQPHFLDPNLSIPISALYPLSELLSRTKDWNPH